MYIYLSNFIFIIRVKIKKNLNFSYLLQSGHTYNLFSYSVINLGTQLIVWSSCANNLNA